MDKQFDVIIIGSGVAGLFAALHLDRTKRVLLLCKQEMMLCNSALAQGGVAAVTDRVHDTPESIFMTPLLRAASAMIPTV